MNASSHGSLEGPDHDEEEDIHVCGSCKSSFLSIEGFVEHKRTCVSRKKPAVIATKAKPLKPLKASYPCSVCSFSSPHPQVTSRHEMTHSGEKPFPCPECGKGFSRKDKLLAHSRRIHSPPGTLEKPHACPECPYRAPDSNSLKKHSRVHSGDRPFACQLCPYRSKDSSQLTVHLRSHTGDSPFICPLEGCLASFKTNSDLKRHVRSHTGEKPYACPFCDHRVAIKSNLDSHISSHHRSERGFTCKTCSYSTDNLSALKTHEKSHSGPLFPCESCPFTSKSQMALSAHRRRKHGPSNNLFHCSYCSFTTRWEGGLSAHVNKKHGRSPPLLSQGSLSKTTCSPNFVCQFCKAGFVREDSLSSHLRQHKTAKVIVHDDCPPGKPQEPSEDTQLRVQLESKG